MCVAWNPAEVSAFWASIGYREFASTSAACGAISRSAMSRTASRIASCSSVRAYRPALLPTGSRLAPGVAGRAEGLLESGVAGEHLVGQVGLEAGHLGAQPLVAGGGDSHGQPGGVAAATDAHRGHRHTGRHLHD